MRDDKGLHIQTEEQYQIQLQHQLADLGAGDSDLSQTELYELQMPEWLAVARAQ